MVSRKKKTYSKISKPEEETKEVKKEKPKRNTKVTFAAWFDKARKKYKLRDYQDFALLTFFKKHGLTEIEDPEKYEDLFKKF